MKSTKKVLITGFCTEDTVNGRSYFGGAAGGIALNLASFDVLVGLLSVLGSDVFSRRYEKELLSRKVDISLVTKVNHRLPLLTLTSTENSETARTFEDFGTRTDLKLLIPSTKLLNDYQILHVVNTPKNLCDYLANHFVGEISYCPGSLFFRDNSVLSTKLLKRANFVFCNEEEYELLKKIFDLSQLFSHSIRMICITYGAQGIEIKTKNTSNKFQLEFVEKVVDITGAGDAVVVGFLKEWIIGSSLEQGVQEGIRLAAKVVQKKGVLLTP